MFDLPVPEDWRLVKLSDLGEVNRGRSRHRPRDAKHLYNGAFPFVQTGDVKASQGRITSYTQTYSAEGLAQSRLWPKGTMCITIAANIAETGILQFPACFPDSLIGFIPDKNKCNVYFIEYVFRLLRARIQAQATGSVQDNINLQTLERLLFPVPNLEEQNRIANILCSFDDKIELNCQINQTLEQIAQALFKSWFVDFEPTRAKIIIKQKGGDKQAQELAAQAIICGAVTLEDLATFQFDSPPINAHLLGRIHAKLDVHGGTNAAVAGSTGAANAQTSEALGDNWLPESLAATAALFPNALVDSELGEIPEGWEVKTFGDVAQCFDSKRIPLSKKKREEKKPGNIPYYGATSIMDYVNEWIFDDIYLLLGEDGSVIKEDGTPFVQYIWGKTWVNNHAHVLQGKNGVSTEQLMIFIQNESIAAYITGAVQLKLNQGNMNSIPFLDGGSEINSHFYRLIKPIYAKVRATVETNQILTSLRNTLLPKLLSGEVSVNTPQAELESA